MRKLEKEMVSAVNGRYTWESGNTKVNVSSGDVFVYLHDNLIFKIVRGVRSFTLCGWNTPTTRSRLNALGVDVCCRNFAPCLDGVSISSDKWYDIN